MRAWTPEDFRTKPRRSKYRNIRMKVDGFTFDSKKEAQYYIGLKLRKATKAEGLVDFERQKTFPLVVNGETIAKYRADFVEYYATPVEQGTLTSRKVVDVKGMRTREYILKRKLMKALYGIDITEV